MPSYTHPVRILLWHSGLPAAQQLRALTSEASTPGLLVVRFRDAAADGVMPWDAVEPWLRSRSVTVADVGGALGGCALEVALCCDLVFVRDGTSLDLPAIDSPPGAGLLWALTRAGYGALARVLLDGGSMRADEAVQVGLVHQVVADDADLPLPDAVSIAALTSARDLMRSRADGGAGRALELATFRLLFAAGDPEEGARAFLDRRSPRFGGEGGDGHPASPTGSAVTRGSGHGDGDGGGPVP
jgi:enoyl-CoA hydratase/carnithine racemase